MLIVSHFFLWVAVILLVITAFALARRLSLLSERIAPGGVASSAPCPRVGDCIPHLHVTAHDGQTLDIGPGHMGLRPTLLLFISAACPSCRNIMPFARQLARREALDLVFIGRGDADEHVSLIHRLGLADCPLVTSPDIAQAFQVDAVPYAIFIRSDGILLARGLVQNADHLEALADIQHLAVCETKGTDGIIQRRILTAKWDSTSKH